MTTDAFFQGLLAYGSLSPEERRALAAHAEAHPSLQGVHDEVAAVGTDASPDAYRGAVVAQYAATRRLPQPPPPHLRAFYERLEALLAADPALAARLDEIEAHLAALDAGQDPEADFAALAGRSPASGRVQDPPSRYGRLFRAAATVVFGIALLYGLLAAVSLLLRSDLDRLAALPPEAVRVEGYSLRTRGSAPASSPDALYLEALAHARSAWREPLGLFPHYREAPLREAIRLLEETVERAPLDDAGFVRHEALFLLARLRIAERDLDGARAALRQLITERARQADAALALLRDLDAATS